MEINKIYCMDVLEGLKQLEDNSVDAVVTDPPYELGFMGKHWDSTGIAYNVDMWKGVYRVMKPGGHLLSFGGSRTYHRMACAIEDAGFEIRDQIMWVFGSGFPKSLDISKAIDKVKGAEREVISKIPSRLPQGQAKGWGNSGVDTFRDAKRGTVDMDITIPFTSEAKEWSGWGTALKPAHEPIVLARKPLSEKTVAENVLKWGTGGLNIDGCKIGTESRENPQAGFIRRGRTDEEIFSMVDKNKPIGNVTVSGRFPANFIHDGSDEVEEVFAKAGMSKSSPVGFKGVAWKHSGNTKDERTPLEYQREFNDFGSASRFFYCAKASKSEREQGLSIEPTDDKRITPMAGRGQGGLKCKICNKWKNSGNPCICDNPDFEEVKFNSKPNLNIHPTIKPLALMEYLIKLVTKEKQLVLDPFIGSGTTALACTILNRNFIGFEISQEYCNIAQKRIQSPMIQAEIQKNKIKKISIDDWL